VVTKFTKSSASRSVAVLPLELRGTSEVHAVPEDGELVIAANMTPVEVPEGPPSCMATVNTDAEAAAWVSVKEKLNSIPEQSTTAGTLNQLKVSDINAPGLILA